MRGMGILVEFPGGPGRSNNESGGPKLEPESKMNNEGTGTVVPFPDRTKRMEFLEQQRDERFFVQDVNDLLQPLESGFEAQMHQLTVDNEMREAFTKYLLKLSETAGHLKAKGEVEKLEQMRPLVDTVRDKCRLELEELDLGLDPRRLQIAKRGANLLSRDKRAIKNAKYKQTCEQVLAGLTDLQHARLPHSIR